MKLSSWAKVLAPLAITGCLSQPPAGHAPESKSEAATACLSGDSGANSERALKELVGLCTAALGDSRTDSSTRANILIARGVALRNLGQFEASLVDLTEAVRLDTGSARAFRMRGWTLRELDRYTAAEVQYDRALSLEDHWQAYLSRCVVRMDMLKYVGALEDCKAALERNRNADALYFTSWLHARRGACAESVPLLEEARLSEDAPARIFEQLARSYECIGERAAAVRVLEEGSAHFPENEELRRLLQKLS